MNADTEPTPGTDITPADEQALAQAAIADISDEDLVLPLLRLTHGQSKAVLEGEVEPGVFRNSLTGEDHGSKVELIFVRYFKGRFYEKDGDVFVANGDVAPSNWPDEYAGKRFVELPDAEELFKEAANAEGGEWGSGPPIRTTHNFVGFLADDLGIPVRVSLQRTSNDAAKKINTILRFRARTGAPWDRTFVLSTAQRTNKRDQQYYVVVAEEGRETSPEERQAAVQLATELELSAAKFVGDEPDRDPKAKPAEAEGALGV